MRFSVSLSPPNISCFFEIKIFEATKSPSAILDRNLTCDVSNQSMLGDSVTFWETQLLPLHYYHFSVRLFSRVKN